MLFGLNSTQYMYVYYALTNMIKNTKNNFSVDLAHALIRRRKKKKMYEMLEIRKPMHHICNKYYCLVKDFY